MDPERQWIARLEPETPDDGRPGLDEAPLARVPRLVAGGVVAACGAAEAVSFFADDLAILRVAAPVIAGALVLATTVARRRRARAVPSES